MTDNGRIAAAEYLCEMLAEDEQFLRQGAGIQHTPDPEEYLHYKQFFQLWKRLAGLQDVVLTYPRNESAARKADWKNALTVRNILTLMFSA